MRQKSEQPKTTIKNTKKLKNAAEIASKIGPIRAKFITDHFQTLMKEASVVYIDHDKKYGIVNKDFLELVVSKLRKSQGQVQRLKEAIHEKDVHMRYLELGMEEQIGVNDVKERCMEAENKHRRAQIEDLLGKLDEAYDKIDELTNFLERKPETKMKFWAKTEKKINHASTQSQTLYYQSNYRLHWLTRACMKPICIPPAQQCQKQCQTKYCQVKNTFKNNIGNLNSQLEDKLAFMSRVSFEQTKLKPENEKLKQENVELKQELEKVRGQYTESRMNAWRDSMNKLVSQVQAQWKEIESKSLGHSIKDHLDQDEPIESQKDNK